MPSIPYDDAIRSMVDDDPQIGLNMLEDAFNALFRGDMDEGRIHLRQYVKATIGFQELAKRTGKQDKNLMRSLSATGNPTAANLFEIIQACTKVDDLTVTVRVEAA